MEEETPRLRSDEPGAVERSILSYREDAPLDCVDLCEEEYSERFAEEAGRSENFDDGRSDSLSDKLDFNLDSTGALCVLAPLTLFCFI